MPKRVKITENELPFLYPQPKLKVTRMGNVTEVQMCTHRNNRQYIKVLPGKQYINLTTGEVKEFRRQRHVQIIPDHFAELLKTSESSLTATRSTRNAAVGLL